MLVSVPRPEMSRVARMSRGAALERYLRGHAERVLALRVEVLEAEVVGDVQDEGGRRLRLPARGLRLVAELGHVRVLDRAAVRVDRRAEVRDLLQIERL